MATWEDVRRIATALPHVTEPSSGDWRVKDKLFVWERPLRKSDYAALGSAAPTGPILGARVEAVDVKDVLIAENPDVYFTTPHFNGYPAILVQLDHISVEDLQDLVVDAWLACAPKRLVKEYLATQPR
jgi:hypothetical protein